jgi:serine O-acetyltransferase
VIRSLDDLKRYQQADLAAHNLARWRWHDRYRHPMVAFQRQLRRTEFVSNRKGGAAWRIVRAWFRWRLRERGLRIGLDIPPNVFGPGLSIRFGPIVVHPDCRVGERCRIHSGVCLGVRDGEVPMLGDDCYLGPGAKVYGGVVLGNRTKVGPNCVVGKSYPESGTILVAARHMAARLPEREEAEPQLVS